MQTLAERLVMLAAHRMQADAGRGKHFVVKKAALAE